MNILYYTMISMGVSLSIGIMLNAKIKISILGAALAGICYCVFVLCPSPKLGYFLSTLLLTLLCELMAKKVKTPSTMFLIIGIYPLVPGVGIYKTIIQIMQADYVNALKTGGDTFVYIALMATAIAIISIIFGKTSEERFEKRRNRNPELWEDS